jgi:hypothetical protein
VTVNDDYNKWDETWSDLGNLPEVLGLKALYTKSIDGRWHYAIVSWAKGVPTVLVEMVDGEVTYAAGQTNDTR